MGKYDNDAEDARIAAFGEKVTAQTLRVRTLQSNEAQHAQEQKVLDAMRQNEAQAILNRSLTRAFDDHRQTDAEAAE